MQIKEMARVSAASIKELVLFNKRMAFFAINNTCNSRCEMCSIWKSMKKGNVKYKDAVKVLGKLKENNFKALQITGGEPFLNPDIFKILKKAKEMGFFVLVVTNGSLITEEYAKRLARMKIDQTSVSFHHHNPDVLEKIENHEGIFEKACKGIENLRKAKAHVSALCTISKYNMNDIEETIKFIEGMNLKTSFCIPVTLDQTSFSLGGNDCVNLSKEELRRTIRKILQLKKKGHKIINNSIYLRDILACLNGRSNYDCYGGSKIWFVDWNLKVYPCMGKGIGRPIEEEKFEDHDVCKECLIQCFREPSVFMKSRREALKVFGSELRTYIR